MRSKQAAESAILLRGRVARQVAPPELEEHSTLLDRALHGFWNLGRNIILLWAPRAKGVEVLVIPHYEIANFATAAGPGAAPAANLMDEILAGPKQTDLAELARIADLIGYESETIDLAFAPGNDLPFDVIEQLVKRYSLSFVQDRAVALFDIVGFSLLSALEQVTQLNSLSYSVNAAHSRMLSKEIDISFARTTTGDGFYVWNRDRSIQANINLYHFMHLVMADNAIAASKAKGKVAPKLRTCFHVGGHYEFYQSEGLNPTFFSYIVGDVTIELARMIEKAVPGQVVVGDFMVPMPDEKTGEVRKIDSIRFIEETQGTLSNLKGLVLSGDAVESIKCYLTGGRKDDGSFSIKRYVVADKHGRTRHAFNAKINIYREKAAPIFLGVQDQDVKNMQVAGEG